MKYKLALRIEGLPKRTNNSHAAWQAKAAEAKLWKHHVYVAVDSNRPAQPLTKAKLTLTRHSSQRPDHDGLVSSFKHVIDGLIMAKVLIDDKHDVIGVPTYQWEQAPIRQGHITMLVEEL